MDTFEMLDKEEQEALNELEQLSKEDNSKEIETAQEAGSQIEEDTVKVQTVDSKAESEIDLNSFDFKLNPEKANDVEYLKNRLFTSLGMNKKLSKDLKSFEEQYTGKLGEKEQTLSDLQKKLEELESQRQSQVITPKQEELSLKEMFTGLGKDYEIDDGFINDLSKVFSAYKNKADSELNEKLQQKLSEYDSKISKAETQSQQEKFWNNIYLAVPDAKEIVKGDFDRFEAWLEQSHYGNLTRGELFESAYQKNDASTVAKFFEDYSNEIRNTKKQSESIPDNIASQVSAKSLKAQTGTVKNKYTMAQIDKFYDDDARGKYSPEESERISKDIDNAFTEGRILY